MSVIDDLLTVPEREEGGSTAIDRFDYQTAWGLAKALKLHGTGNQYAIAFEFHDDVIELDSSVTPERLRLYQVKTKKSGNWTLKAISTPIAAKGKSAAKPSHAAKMFDSFVKFGDAVDGLIFVSNQACNELGEDHREYDFNKAKPKTVSDFVTALKSQDGKFGDDHLALYRFCYSDLQLGSYERTLMADIADFILTQTGLDEINHRTFGLMLINECRKRSKTLADISDLAALKESKFVTRYEMDTWLALLKEKHAKPADWSAIAPYIKDFQIAKQLNAGWKTYDVERRRRLGATVLKFQNDVRKIVMAKAAGLSDLLDIVEAALPEVRYIRQNWDPMATDNYLRSIILYEYWHET